MAAQLDPVDPLVIKKQNLLRLFYVVSAASAVAFALAHSSDNFLRVLLFALSFGGSILAVVILYRFLRLIDQFEREYTRGALLFAFIALLSLLVIEAFLESFGFRHPPAYANVVLALAFWSLGLIYSSWQRHWRRGYEE